MVHIASKPITIFHNPACGTSRKVLALLQERYRTRDRRISEEAPARAQLREMLARSGVPARDFLRNREPLYKDLDLDNPKWSEDQLIGFLAENPSLLNRPS